MTKIRIFIFISEKDALSLFFYNKKNSFWSLDQVEGAG
ncbi:hypothetical protein J2Z18_004189 [Paenibacillus lactis]|uniref:Uncharacterized protein n=1 Tax=Paenibacillus lactis TaxID=228574 RepID=A0ABS4FFR0_9BACL|nr:hypothetical protein [Paenibacillus lactis]